MSVVRAKTTFTLAEAAALLSCHTETLRRAIKDGELAAAKLGRGYRISRVDLEAFWSACGGGDLFGPEELAALASQMTRGDARKPGGRKKKPPKGPQQLLLLPGSEDAQ